MAGSRSSTAHSDGRRYKRRPKLTPCPGVRPVKKMQSITATAYEEVLDTATLRLAKALLLCKIPLDQASERDIAMGYIQRQVALECGANR